MLMLPNVDCVITKAGSYDNYGQEVPGKSFRTRCGVVRLASSSERTSVRADSSASRGAASEKVSDARLLFPPDTDVGFGDKLEVAGVTLKVMGVWQRHDIVGRLDHLQVDANAWA